MELLANPSIRDFAYLRAGAALRFAGQYTGRGSGYKQYKRAERFQEGRLNETGQRFNHAAKTWNEYNKYLSQERAETGAWTFIGPTEYKLGPSGPMVNHLFTGGLGRVNCLACGSPDGESLYLGTAGGGVWKTADGGAAWSPLLDDYPVMAVSGIAIAPDSPSTLYILTGDGDGYTLPSMGVLKSTDGGETWSQTGLAWSEDELTYGYRLSIHPADAQVIFAATTRGLYRTQDGGAVWKLVLHGRLRDVEFKPDDPRTMYAASVDTVFRSTDSGLTWRPVTWGLPSPGGIGAIVSERVELAVTPANPQVVYALYGGPTGFLGAFIGLFRSDNAGESFSLRSSTPNILGSSRAGDDSISHPWYDLAIAVSPHDAAEVHIGSVNTWQSNDAGSTWQLTSYWLEQDAQALYMHPDVHDLLYCGENLYAATDGGIYRKRPNRPRWENLSAGLGITEIFRIAVDPRDPGVIYFGAQDNGTNRLEGRTAVQVWGGDGGECRVDEFNANTVYISSQFGVLMRSIDRGENFLPITPQWPLPAQPASYITPFVLHPKAPWLVYSCYTDAWIGVSLPSAGVYWYNITNGAIGSDPGVQIAVAPSNPAVLYVAKPRAVYQGIFVGTQWLWILRTGNWPPNGPPITNLAVSSTDPNRIWITLGGYSHGNKVFESADGGMTWTNISGSLANLPVNAIAYEGGFSNAVYIGMDVGVYYRNDSLHDWTPFTKGLPKVVIHDLDVHPGTRKIRAASFGRGVWESELYSPRASENERRPGVKSARPRSMPSGRKKPVR